MVQLVKRLLFKGEDLSSISWIHLKKLARLGKEVYAFNLNTGEAEIGRAL